MSLDVRFRTSLIEGRDPAGFLQDAETAPACVLGSPPRALHPVHQPRFVNRWVERIRHCIAEPVEVQWINGERHVQVLGQIVLRFAADGTITPYLWTLGSDVVCEEVDPYQINLAGLPYGWLWLDRFRGAFQYELIQRLGRRDHRVPAYAAWVFERIRARVRREGQLAGMRRRVAEALALDEQALAIARRIGLAADPAVSVRTSTYNEVMAHRSDYDTLSRECPGLVTWYSVLRPVIAPEGEPAARLRQRALDLGLAPASWRVVHRGNGRLLRLLPEFYLNRYADAAEDLLRIVDMLRPSTQPPVWFLRTLLYYFGNFGQRYESYFEELQPLATPLRRLMALVERAGSAALADIRDNLYRVVTWLGDDESAAAHPYARRASWRWFKGRADAWHEARQKKAQSDQACWEVPFGQIEVDGLSVVALRTPFDLWEEGRTMRHCAPRLEAYCRKGTTLVFSIRRAGRSRPVATGRADWYGAWRLHQVAACANTVAPGAAQRIAQRVVDLINAQGWRAGNPRGSRDWARQLHLDHERDDVDVDAERRAALGGRTPEDVLVAVAHDGLQLDAEARAVVDDWFRDSYDQNRLYFPKSGTLVTSEQVRGKLATWLEETDELFDLLERSSAIDEERAAELHAGDAPTNEEMLAATRQWIADVIEGDPDLDEFATWFFCPIEDAQGRRAVLLGLAWGYSFTIVRREWTGVYRDEGSARAALAELGYSAVPSIEELERDF